jgi:hypothetical protein
MPLCLEPGLPQGGACFAFCFYGCTFREALFRRAGARSTRPLSAIKGHSLGTILFPLQTPSICSPLLPVALQGAPPFSKLQRSVGRPW